MAKCLICNSRKGKRKCKAKNGFICSLCCGKNRGSLQGCDDTCPWFSLSKYQTDFSAIGGPTKIVSGEGEEILFSKAIYRIKSRDKVKTALSKIDNLAFGEEKKDSLDISWLEKPFTEENMPKEDVFIGPRSLGSIILSNEQLTLECMTKGRLQRGMKMIEEACSQLLELPPQVYLKTTAAALKEVEGKPASEEEDRFSPEIKRELTQTYLDHYYNKVWINEKIPALDGESPLDTSKTKAGRKKLKELFEYMEGLMKHLPADSPNVYDFSKLKTTLGIGDY